jgi:CarD family transcriptional regulator
MRLVVGEKVAYPNQGVCLVEDFKSQSFGSLSISGYTLRVQHDNSTIFVPEQNAETIGIRPLICPAQCRRLIELLGSDFEPFCGDWKARSREFSEKLRTGDVFQVAEVLKMLTYLSHEKRLSFREQTLLEKSRFLIVSEIRNVCGESGEPGEAEILQIVEAACARHLARTVAAEPVTVH